jgi:hypothetical protein
VLVLHRLGRRRLGLGLLLGGRRAVEGAPGLGPDDPVGDQVVLELERHHRAGGLRAERAVGADRRAVLDEALLQAHHRLAAGPDAQQRLGALGHRHLLEHLAADRVAAGRVLLDLGDDRLALIGVLVEQRGQRLGAAAAGQDGAGLERRRHRWRGRRGPRPPSSGRVPPSRVACLQGRVPPAQVESVAAPL